MSSLTLRGRSFSDEDIELIRRCVNEHYDKGRSRISVIICQELGWKQPNGWLKDRACRDVLLSLQEMGAVTLPPRRNSKKTVRGKEKTKRTSLLEGYDLETPVTSFPKNIELQFAKGNKLEQIWNALVDKYHYLGHQIVVGRCIKYLVGANERLLGAIAFSSPAWKLASRDALLVSLGIEREDIRDLVINNSRFLILPNVRIPNLASAILSEAAKRVVVDWKEYYSIEPIAAETFVQPSQFLGACYRAANWLEVGMTSGYSKSGASHMNSQEPKYIFLYGLNRHMRRKLFRAVTNPYEI